MESRLPCLIMKKLGTEIMRPEQNLRFLVAHANLLRSMVITEIEESQKEEEEQNDWFTESLREATAVSHSIADGPSRRGRSDLVNKRAMQRRRKSTIYGASDRDEMESVWLGPRTEEASMFESYGNLSLGTFNGASNKLI